MLTKYEDWTMRNCRFAQFIERAKQKPDKSDKDEHGYIQWTTPDRQNFFPAAKEVKKLDPGFYNVVIPMGGGLFFEKIAMGEDGLIKFPETTSDRVVAEIEKFWDREQLFKESKLTFKRGILLYGPPGSGKTCTVKLVIENVIKRGGVVIKFSTPGSFEAGMGVLRKIQPETPVICLMEDIDAILHRNNESDVINILDGVSDVHKVVFLATTNYPEKLGSRIMNRPSRFDKRFEIGMPNAESRRIYLSTIGGDKISKPELERWVKDTDQLSISHLKELYVAVKILGDEYADAIATLRNMKVQIKSSDFDDYGKSSQVYHFDSGGES